jgi:hypothetical protein
MANDAGKVDEIPVKIDCPFCEKDGNDTEETIACPFFHKDAKGAVEQKHNYTLVGEKGKIHGGDWIFSCPNRYKGDSSDKFLAKLDENGKQQLDTNGNPKNQDYYIQMMKFF